MMNAFRPALAAGLVAAMLASADPAAARMVQLVVSGNIVNGDDSGNDLVDVSVINNVYVHSFAPGNFFGTTGSLAGKAIQFRVVYDTSSPDLPIGTGGLFEDSSGAWPFGLAPQVRIGGSWQAMNFIVPGTFAYAPTAALQLTDGTSDRLDGAFTSLTFSGNNLSNYFASSLNFSAILPASFFTTDGALPGSLAAPGFGFAGGAASGTGNFLFQNSTCFFQCSYKAASGSFDVTGVLFGAVPEPASWAMLVIGFGLVGSAARRQRWLSPLTA